MKRRTPAATLVLTVLAGLLLAAGGALAYVRAEIARERPFSERLVSALDDDAVREVVTERSVDALVNASSGDLLAIRPLATAAVDSLVVTGAFRNIAALGVREAHRALVDENGSLVVELSRGGPALIDGVRGLSPAVAARIPANVTPVFAELEPGDVELGAARVILDVSSWWWLVVAAGLAASAAALALSGDWRRTLGHLGVAVAGGCALVAAAVTLVGAVAVVQLGTVEGLDDDRTRDALAGVWRALLGDLRTAALLVGAGGLLVAAVTSGLVSPPARTGRLAGWVRRAGRLPVWVRSAALVAAGLACLLAPRAVLTALVFLAGAALLYLGAAGIAGELAASAPADRRRGRRGLVAGVAAVAALGVVTLAAFIALRPPELPQPASAAPRAGCNGSRALCSRRLNEVVYPGTHNSYTAADEPGWLFANQRFGIGPQLRAGIRALLIDVHWGVLDERAGRVRTDIDADGQTRNKIAQELSPEALRTADRLAGEVGAGELEGTPRPFLCHGLCELGYEPLDQELTVIRRFLEREPTEVLLVIVEDYVPPEEMERSMRRTGLLRYAAELELERDEPLPTLGELVRSDKRLVMFAEFEGGTLPWYMPAFAFIQDTPLGAQAPGELRCELFRGEDDHPIFLMNHWIDRFPPRVSDHKPINQAKFLRDRIRRCTSERGIAPGIVAVDFYEIGAVVEVARELNESG